MAVERWTERAQAFDLNLTNNRWAVPTYGAEVATLSAEAHSTWAGTVTVYRSHDGVTPAALETVVSFAAVGMCSAFDCSGFPFIVWQVTATAGSAKYANLITHLSKSVN